MQTNARKVTAIAAVLVALFATSCGVSKSKYTAATNSVQELTTKNQNLQKALDDVNAKNADLQKHVGSLQSTIDSLDAAAKALAAQADSSKARANTLQSTYEGLVGQLKDEVSSGNVQVQQMRDGIAVSLAQDILFNSGSADLDKQGKDVLAKVAGELAKSDAEINVIGHTDNQKIGGALAKKYATNWELGAARASQITRLFAKEGIQTERMLAVSAGDGRPRADNSTPEGRAQNRRIEIRLRPAGTTEAMKN